MPRIPPKSTAPQGLVRLQRLMADAGVAARRVCEEMIEQGHVEVNGKVVNRLPVFVDPFKDSVSVDGRELARARRKSSPERGGERPEMSRLVYVLVNKPPRVLTAASDPTGRITVNELVKYHTPARMFPVGRLEWEAAGLVLLTNDGELSNVLTHPRYGVDRVFELQAKGFISPDFIADLQKGVNLKAQRAAREAGKRYQPILVEPVKHTSADSESGSGAKTILRVTVKPGGTAKLMDLFGEAGIKIARMVQVSMGPLKLVDVKPGEWRDLERHEVTALKKLAARSEAAGGPAPRPVPSPSKAAPAARPSLTAGGAIRRGGSVPSDRTDRAARTRGPGDGPRGGSPRGR